MGKIVGFCVLIGERAEGTNDGEKDGFAVGLRVTEGEEVLIGCREGMKEGLEVVEQVGKLVETFI